MFRLKGLLCLLLGCLAFCVFAQDTWVNGYYRKNGTYVQGHWRHSKGSTSTTTTKPTSLYTPPKKISYRIPKIRYNQSRSSLRSIPKLPKLSFDRKVRSELRVSSSLDNRFSVGDRIVSIKDRLGKSYAIKSRDDLASYLTSHSPSDEATLKVQRNGKYLTRTIKSFGDSVHY